MAKIKSNAHLYLTESGTPAPVPIDVTSVTNADPAVLTLDGAVPAGFVAGDFLQFEGTGAALLDGQFVKVTAINNTTPAAPVLTLALDGTEFAGAVGAVGTASLYARTSVDATLLEACMANITVAGVAPDSITMDDMCSTTTVLGDAKPPTFSFSGFVDQDSPGFRNLVQASLESPKTARMLLIDFTADGGYIMGPAEIGEITVTAGVGQGLQFSGSGVFTEVPTYSWALPI